MERKPSEHMLDLDFNLDTHTPRVGAGGRRESHCRQRHRLYRKNDLRQTGKKCRHKPGHWAPWCRHAVSGRTDYLVCGENVGAAKIKKAETLSVKIVTENAYLTMIEGIAS
jgi:DNA ligase (NAD+)